MQLIDSSLYCCLYPSEGVLLLRLTHLQSAEYVLFVSALQTCHHIRIICIKPSNSTWKSSRFLRNRIRLHWLALTLKFLHFLELLLLLLGKPHSFFLLFTLPVLLQDWLDNFKKFIAWHWFWSFGEIVTQFFILLFYTQDRNFQEWNLID